MIYPLRPKRSAALALLLGLLASTGLVAAPTATAATDPPAIEILGSLLSDGSPATFGGPVVRGLSLRAEFSCSAAADAPPVVSCLDDQGEPSGVTVLESEVVGTYSFSVTGVNAADEQVTREFSYAVVDAPTAEILSPAPGGVYLQGSLVEATFRCTDGPTSDYGVSFCFREAFFSGQEDFDKYGGFGPSYPAGTHEVTPTALIHTARLGPQTLQIVAARNSGDFVIEAGLDPVVTSIQALIARVEQPYLVVGPPVATIDDPVDGAVFDQGAVVPTSFRCTDGAYAPGIDTCSDGTVTTGGTTGTGVLDTTTPGRHTYTVTATSQAGFSSASTVTYWVRDQIAVHGDRTGQVSGLLTSGTVVFDVHVRGASAADPVAGAPFTVTIRSLFGPIKMCSGTTDANGDGRCSGEPVLLWLGLPQHYDIAVGETERFYAGSGTGRYALL